MRRIIFLLILIFAMVGCGLEEAAQDTSASVNQKAEENTAVLTSSVYVEEVSYRIQCQGMTIPNSNQALVTYSILVNNENIAEKQLYGGGILESGEASFDKSTPIACEGDGEMDLHGVTAVNGTDPAGYLIQPHSTSLTAQIDGVMTPLGESTLTGFSRSGSEPTINILVNNENILVNNENILVNNENITEFSLKSCQGRMIPDSNKALIIFTAELASGKQFMGSGVFEPNNEPFSAQGKGFECHSQAQGYVVTQDLQDWFKNSSEGTMATLFFSELTVGQTSYKAVHGFAVSK